MVGYQHFLQRAEQVLGLVVALLPKLIDKDDLIDFPDIVELLADRPERFIIFCDE
jgi:predicted AAA+ superfamily ATPase